ncbi:MAG TPA: HEAT repeat domain-containing protein [Myxococcaceae bacterium]|nr:HEAT repeat domain-containing protein [Myxococcaceae bacterium]
MAGWSALRAERRSDVERPAQALASAPSLPPPPSPAPPRDEARYVGSKACGECHPDEHSGWERDWHARALSPPSPATVEGRFDGAHFHGTSSEAWMRHDRGEYLMRTLSPRGAQEDFPVSWVIGGKRMQDYVTVLPGGRWQVLPVYFHLTGHPAWVDYTESKQGALTVDHPFFWANFRRMAVHECLDCHVTGLDAAYERPPVGWTTRFVEPGVACESCHGPGGKHADSQSPADIFQPRKAPPELSTAMCGQCHGPRVPLFALLDGRHRFRAGDRYDDWYQALEVVDGNGRSGDFFADGRPKSSSFEYQALVQSRCYRLGGAACVSCHTAPHQPHQPGEVKPPPRGAPPGAAGSDAATCGSCHADLVAKAAAHSHHADARAQRCAACHMPPVVTGVLDQFADHSLDVPAPENTVRHGIPNACNVCHQDRTPQAMADALAKLWPDARRRTERRLRLADAIDEATVGSSGPALQAVVRDREEAPILRGAAMSLLAQRFPPAAVDPALELLDSPDQLLRARGAEALGLSRARGAADRLALLAADRSLWVRLAASNALGAVGDPRGLALLERLAEAPDSEALPKPHLALGAVLAREGNVGPAITQLERGLRALPYQVESLGLLSDLLVRQGRRDEARARLEEALQFDRQEPKIRKRLEALGSAQGP